MRVFSDTTIIRSHVLISGFIDNYMIWNKHTCSGTFAKKREQGSRRYLCSYLFYPYSCESSAAFASMVTTIPPDKVAATASSGHSWEQSCCLLDQYMSFSFALWIDALHVDLQNLPNKHYYRNDFQQRPLFFRGGCKYAPLLQKECDTVAVDPSLKVYF